MRPGLIFVVLGGVMAALYLTACSPAAPADAAVSASSHTITGVAVVDVEKGIVLPDQTVIIEGGLIQAVGPRAKLSAPKGAHVIDGRGLYLMPGLVDAHVHYFDAAGIRAPDDCQWRPARSRHGHAQRIHPETAG